MKILFIIIILYLISGPVDSSDVNGYSGGSVTIISGIQCYGNFGSFRIFTSTDRLRWLSGRCLAYHMEGLGAIPSH
ncbi:hypothetical protein QTP70_007163 [Hemibagrus guttatus]|uniref:Uncharacterized protein n=1 Tax=Hemibagrus guttatus TaxID=175788 RepID=A0AAE0QDQ8_9TELE|nr:hypothetical protein QTP70_007163 [Hemibagrus guttatus]